MPRYTIGNCTVGAVLGLLVLHPDSVRAQNCAPLVDEGHQQFAVTLAGGGTKAASFSMGVLAALAKTEMPLSARPERGNDRRALWQADLISSVSGGSYAGYFLYSRLIARGGEAATTPQDVLTKEVDGYFADCIPARLHAQIGDELGRTEAQRRGVDPNQLFCPSYLNVTRESVEDTHRKKAAWAERDEVLHQQFLRCHQDVLAPDDCYFGSETGDEARNLTSAAALTAVTAVSMPFSWVFNLLFDWPLNLSPSRVAYRDGIGLSYGFRPKDSRAIEGTLEWALKTGSVAGGSWLNGRPIPDPDKLDFASLKKLESDLPYVPHWAINATAAPSRSILGWTNGGDVSMAEHIFHMTGQEQCAESVGPIPIDKSSLVDASEAESPTSPNQDVQKRNALSPLLTAVNASAAFLDGNERAIDQPWRFTIAGGLQLTNLNWGVDVRNVEQTDNGVKRRSSYLREAIHYAVPVFYLGESLAAYATHTPPVFVRLVDGGSSDNLGAYGPIVARVRDVLISDHAQDEKGALDDLCFLRNELYIRNALYLTIPGLEDWPNNCLVEKTASRSRKVRDATDQGAVEVNQRWQKLRDESVKEPAYFPIWAWPYPYLAACVSNEQEPSGNCNGPEDRRLWIIKPAFDYPHWLAKQTAVNDRSDREIRDSRRLSSCGKNTELPCETAAALLTGDLFLNRRSIFDTAEFPQGSTVRMTFNSSATAYGAYRELGSHYARQAIEAIDRARADRSGEFFGRILRWQAAHPIRKASSLYELKYLAKREDIRLENWQIEARDCVRRTVGGDDRPAYSDDDLGCRPEEADAAPVR